MTGSPRNYWVHYNAGHVIYLQDKARPDSVGSSPAFLIRNKTGRKNQQNLINLAGYPVGRLAPAETAPTPKTATKTVYYLILR
jgi:hypothetical protein